LSKIEATSHDRFCTLQSRFEKLSIQTPNQHKNMIITTENNQIKPRDVLREIFPSQNTSNLYNRNPVPLDRNFEALNLTEDDAIQYILAFLAAPQSDVDIIENLTLLRD
jgi:hypothetical protein